MNKRIASHDASSTPRVSVIIPSFQSADLIRTCLASLDAQVTRETFEVVVVDSSRDATCSVIAKEFPHVRLIVLDEQTYPGPARNFGMDVARGEFIAFVDTKLCLPSHWIEQVCRDFDDLDVDAVAGPRTLEGRATFAGKFQFYIEFFDFITIKRAKWVPYAPAGNSAFRRAALDGLRFPEGLRTVEDWVFCSTRRDQRIYLDPKLLASYVACKTWSDAFGHIRSLGFWSGVARSRFPMRGSFLKGRPWASVLLLPYRFCRFLFGFTPRLPLPSALGLIAAAPVFGVGFGVWTASFMRGLAANRHDP